MMAMSDEKYFKGERYEQGKTMVIFLFFLKDARMMYDLVAAYQLKRFFDTLTISNARLLSKTSF